MITLTMKVIFLKWLILIVFPIGTSLKGKSRSHGLRQKEISKRKMRAVERTTALLKYLSEDL